tara:strand:- start:4487 stop:5338 length:852 start_codon:yes stop_codon:yes gene_type:complete
MSNRIKILIIGDGFIGNGLNDFYKGKYDVRLTSKAELDVCSLPSVESFFRENNDFTHVIYAAGIKNIGFCESNPDTAFAVNSEALSLLSLYLPTTMKMIYISTDYVFDGHANSTGSYTETDQTCSTSVYGKSKIAGELVVKKRFPGSVIVRTSGVYGPQCGWVEWLVSAASEQKSVECYTDATNSPTHIDSLAQMIIDVISSNYEGVINLVDSSIMNRHELYSSALTAAGQQTNKLIESSRPTQTCLIPENVSLSNKYFCSLPSVKLPLRSPKFDFLNQMDKS